MAWLKIETAVARHPKLVKAGPSSSWLWICGLAYCQGSETDGFISQEALKYLGVPNAGRFVHRLITVGLWEKVPGGWRVHDYLEHNLSKDQIRQLSEKRAVSGSKGGRAKAAVHKQGAKQVASAAPSKTLANTSDLSCTDLICTTAPCTDPGSTQDVRTNHVSSETAAPSNLPVAMPVRAAAPLHPTHHRAHAHCGRVCVPAALHDTFRRERNHQDADRELRDWYLVIEREWGPNGLKAQEPTGGDEFRFWRARYAEQWPAAPAATTSKPAIRERWRP